VNGEVGSFVYVTGMQVGVIVAGNGKTTITLSLINGNNDFSITLRDATGNESSALSFSVTKVIDNKPVLTLTGLNPQEIEKGSAYIELGASALDDIDGNITNNIMIDITDVNINVVGDYNVTYDVNDSFGNQADTLTRVVQVRDTLAPNTPTLTTSAPTQTTSSSINVEVNGEVGSIVYVNAVQVGIIAGNGKLSIVLNLVMENNDFSITLIDAIGNESSALNITITKVNAIFNDLIINELSSGRFSNSNRWFELYNPTNTAININAYTLKSLSYNGISESIIEFTLPSKVIPAGGYLVIRPNWGDAFSETLPIVENDEVIYLNAGVNYPAWYSNSDGFLELLKNDITVDFVTFGLTYTPTTPSAWTGGVVPTFGSDEWRSIARYKGDSDTNTSADWYVRDFPTYGGVNDVNCSTDADADGIPDCSEVSGSTYAGLDLYAFGARVNQKDIFIEVDYVDSTNGGNLAENAGVVPQQEALEKVRSAFADNNYSVHFDVGDLFDQDGSTINPALMNLGGGNLIPYVAEVSLGCTNNGTDARDYKALNMQTQRKQIFYYMFFGVSQGEGVSGCGELPGNDTIITLGEDNLDKTTQINTNRLYTYQAGVVMHELGHNLNLQHGGDDSVNNKPNYGSVMNYLYATRGLSTIGDNEGDRYYQFSGCTGHYTTLTNSPYESIDDFVIDYSNGVANSIDEVGGVIEADGLGYNTSVPVDFDCDNIPDETLTFFDVNGDGSATVLSDHDDWDLVNIIFARTSAGHASLSNGNPREVPQVTPTMDDRQPVAIETPLPRD
jgi:uncharacterized membrane protein